MCPRKDDYVTRTFRIPIEFDESLREDAEAHGTSVNSLVIKILEKYNESEMVHLSRSLPDGYVH